MEQEDRKVSDPSLIEIEKFAKFMSYQPCVWLCASCFSAIFCLWRNRPWSWMLVLNIMFPFLLYSIVFFVVFLCFKKSYGIRIPFFPKKVRSLAVLLVLLIVLLNIAIFKNDAEGLYASSIRLDALDTLVAQAPQEEDYFVLYYSDDCTQCYNMEDVYQRAFRAAADQTVYCVDLSNEFPNAEAVQAKQITRLPLLVSYQGDREIDRLEGVTSEKATIEFLNQAPNNG